MKDVVGGPLTTHFLIKKNEPRQTVYHFEGNLSEIPDRSAMIIPKLQNSLFCVVGLKLRNPVKLVNKIGTNQMINCQ